MSKTSNPSRNNTRVRPIIITDDGNDEVKPQVKEKFISTNFEASKISLIRMDQADKVDRILECIRDNDGEGADEFLSDMTPKERRNLLSQQILSQNYDEKPQKDNFYRRMDYTWLSMVAAGAGSDQVFEVLVRHGAPLDVREDDGSTIGHAVAYGAYFMPELDSEYVRIYCHFVAQIGSQSKLLDCMTSENGAGARPLEVAAVLGKFDLFYVMMETENLYKNIDIRQGTWNRCTYDFLEYEKVAPEGRREKSPLKIFTFLREKDMDSPGFRRVFGSPPIQAWMRQHVETTTAMLIVWCLIRTVFTAVYLRVLAQVNGKKKMMQTILPNSTVVNTLTCPPAYEIVFPGGPQDQFNDPGMIFLTFCLLSFVIFDTGDFLHYLFYARRQNAFFNRPGNNDAYIVHSLDHRFLQVIFVFNVAATVLFRQAESEGIIYSYVLSILVVSMTYMYFLQFLPGIGYLVIGLQRSLSTFGSFAAIFFLIFLAFALAFYVLNQVCCVTISLTETLYQTFQIFLNQVNILKDFECQWYRREAWTIFHMVYVMFMVILLLNFCIAILSESAIRITNHKDILQDLQYLNASMVIEDRVGWAARPVRSYLHRTFVMGVVKTSVKLRQPFAMK